MTNLLPVLAAFLLVFSTPGFAQSAWPAKPIRLIVPYAAGGATDAVARMLGPELTKAWGQPVTIENRTGGGGLIGNDAVAKSAPDGYTILVAITQLIQSPSLFSKLPYQLSDFIPVTQMTAGPTLLVVHPSMPVKTLAELVALVKATPNKYAYGSFGAGSSAHISGEMLNLQAGLDMQHVPFRGASALANDLLAGQISIGFIDTATARPYIANGKMRPIAVTGATRHKTVPNVPTFTELGYKNYEPIGWTALFVPAGTPKAIVNKLGAEVARIVQTPEMTQRIDALGLTAAGTGVDEFTASVRRDTAIWSEVIRAAKIRLD